jgi:tRNA C32,U32 (ribose-2'-O)-methylase TrmJ
MPASGWKKKTKSLSGVGLTLVNNRKATHKAYNDAEYKASKDVLESVLEVRDFDEVMEQVELAGRLSAANNPLPDLLISSEVNRENLTPQELREQRHVSHGL